MHFLTGILLFGVFYFFYLPFNLWAMLWTGKWYGDNVYGAFYHRSETGLWP